MRMMHSPCAEASTASSAIAAAARACGDGALGDAGVSSHAKPIGAG